MFRSQVWPIGANSQYPPNPRLGTPSEFKIELRLDSGDVLSFNTTSSSIVLDAIVHIRWISHLVGGISGATTIHNGAVLSTITTTAQPRPGQEILSRNHSRVLDIRHPRPHLNTRPSRTLNTQMKRKTQLQLHCLFLPTLLYSRSRLRAGRGATRAPIYIKKHH